MLLANERASTPQKDEIKSLIAMIDEAEKRFLINGALALVVGLSITLMAGLLVITPMAGAR